MKKKLLIIVLASFSKKIFCHKIEVGTLNITEKEKQYVNEALNNNRLSYGPFLKKFESDFATIHDCKYGCVSNSGTSSLQVALQALKEIHNWDNGDEVIVPATTFVATSNIVIHNRMIPVFVDVEKEYYNLDPKLLEAKITTKTKAIIVVHLFGLPCDMDPIIEIAKKHNLKIIEDSCETMFAHYKNRSVGALGDIGCFSMYVAHLLTTGVGGISITNNPEYAIKMRSLVNHGRDSIYISIDDDKNLNEEQTKEVIERRFKFVSIGHSFRITEMEGALGVAQLENWESMIAKRRRNAFILISELKGLTPHIQLPKIRENCTHSFMMFPIVLKNEKKSDLVNFLESKGIETRDMLPLINQPIYKTLFKINPDDYPVATWINESGFYVGCHQNIGEDDVIYLANKIKEFFKIRK